MSVGVPGGEGDVGVAVAEEELSGPRLRLADGDGVGVNVLGSGVALLGATEGVLLVLVPVVAGEPALVGCSGRTRK